VLLFLGQLVQEHPFLDVAQQRAPVGMELQARQLAQGAQLVG
jgi:hypothetical protein